MLLGPRCGVETWEAETERWWGWDQPGLSIKSVSEKSKPNQARRDECACAVTAAPASACGSLAESVPAQSQSNAVGKTRFRGSSTFWLHHALPFVANTVGCSLMMIFIALFPSMLCRGSRDVYLTVRWYVPQARLSGGSPPPYWSSPWNWICQLC